MDLHPNKKAVLRAYFCKVFRENGGPTPELIEKLKSEIRSSDEVKEHVEVLLSLVDEAVETAKKMPVA